MPKVEPCWWSGSGGAAYRLRTGCPGGAALVRRLVKMIGLPAYCPTDDALSCGLLMVFPPLLAAPAEERGAASVRPAANARWPTPAHAARAYSESARPGPVQATPLVPRVRTRAADLHIPPGRVPLHTSGSPPGSKLQ